MVHNHNIAKQIFTVDSFRLMNDYKCKVTGHLYSSFAEIDSYARFRLTISRRVSGIESTTGDDKYRTPPL